METITYSNARWQNSGFPNLWTAVLVGGMVLDFTVLRSFEGVVESLRGDGPAESWLYEPRFALLAALFAFLASIILLVSIKFALRLRARLFLFRIDDEGLTYGHRRWRWDDLPAFKPRGRWVGRHIVFAIPEHIVFTVPEQADWLTRIEGRGRPKVVRIQDIYDTALHDIAATLNAYRERALANKSATGGPHAPEPTQDGD